VHSETPALPPCKLSGIRLCSSIAGQPATVGGPTAYMPCRQNLLSGIWAHDLAVGSPVRSPAALGREILNRELFCLRLTFEVFSCSNGIVQGSALRKYSGGESCLGA
jgi:hypothetical protein